MRNEAGMLRPAPWATCSFRDEDFGEQWHTVGEMLTHEDGPLAVDVVQSISGLTDGPIRQSSPQVRLAGMRLDRGEAEQLARLLSESVALIDHAARRIKSA